MQISESLCILGENISNFTVKIVCIQSFYHPYFFIFKFNAQIYCVYLCIQFRCEENGPKKLQIRTPFTQYFIMMILQILNATQWCFLTKTFYELLHYRFHCSCIISFPSVHTSLMIFQFIAFSPQSISFISSTIVYLINIYLIWLHSYYMVIQPYCQFHFSANPVCRN